MKSEISRAWLRSHKTNSLQRCFYSTKVPRKSYIASKNLLQLWWYNKIPPTGKYFASIAAAAYTFTHVGHENMFTLGPPLLVGSYFGHKYYQKRLFNSESEKIIGKDVDTIRIRSYDETEVENVLKNLDNQFDYFKANIINVTERMIIDYVVKVQSNDEAGEIEKLFIDNDQISINIDDNNFESFILLKIPLSETEIENYSNDPVDFIKFSIPFYSSQDPITKMRIGVIEVYLLENFQENPLFHEYKMKVVITPTGLPSKSLTLTKVYDDIFKSDMLVEYERKNPVNRDDKEKAYNSSD